MKFLGIDGGGTKTEFVIIDGLGEILGHTIMPTCHYKQTSLENFEKVIKDGIEEVCKQINICIEDIDYSFIGIPGYGEIKQDVIILDSIVENILSSQNYKCGNDSEVAWAGSLACEPGINIVAGTGAIGFGVDNKGNTARASGWGHFCGDEGSAYWIGKQVIELFTKQADGRMEKTPLYNIVREELKIQEDFDFLDYVLNHLKMERGKVAQLARLLYMAAKANDKKALEVYSLAAYEQYLTINAIINKLDFCEEILVSYSGGVFNAGKYVLEPLEKNLAENGINVRLIEPRLMPVLGAALYAFKLHLGTISNDIVDRLRLEEKSIL